jgi:hypothetical protein
MGRSGQQGASEDRTDPHGKQSCESVGHKISTVAAEHILCEPYRYTSFFDRDDPGQPPETM